MSGLASNNRGGRPGLRPLRGAGFGHSNFRFGSRLCGNAKVRSLGLIQLCSVFFLDLLVVLDFCVRIAIVIPSFMRRKLFAAKALS